MKDVKPFYTEYGYLIKDVKTGDIDPFTQHPVSLAEAENKELIDGFEWVKVKVTYTEE